MSRYLLMIDGTKVRFLNKDDDPVKFQHIANVLDAVVDSEPDPEPQDEEVWFQWPTEYPGVVIQEFGKNPQWYIGWGVPAHEGIDMKALLGTKIFSVWNGVVTLANSRIKSNAYGWQIRIKHDIDGTLYESAYAHFNTPTHLKIGDVVKRGDVIGIAGSTGNSSGPHLHIMLKLLQGLSVKSPTAMDLKYKWNYNIIDPTPFFKELE